MTGTAIDDPDLDEAESARPAAPAVGGGGQVRNLHKFMMLGTTFARMGLGMLTFIILARYLGPRNFGVMATAIAYSNFVTLVSDFGFGLSALREASAAPERTGRILRETLLAKLLLTLLLTTVTGAAVIALAPREWLPVYALVHAGSICLSIAEMMMVAPRASRRFEVESVLVLTGSAGILAFSGIPVALTGNIVIAAAAFAGSRLIYLALVTIALRRWLGTDGERFPPWSVLISRIRGSTSYAADGILTALSSQVDVLIFGVIMTAHDMGLYQAGARLVQVIVPIAGVLSTIYMPTLSAAAINGDDAAFRKNATRLNWEFAMLAIAGGIAVAALGPFATDLLYGDRYDELKPLWAGFAAYAILRFASASYGIQLAALGFIRTRIAAQLASIAVFALSALILLPMFGLAAAPWLLAASALPVFLILGIAVARANRGNLSYAWSLGLSLLATLGMALVSWVYG